MMNAAANIEPRTPPVLVVGLGLTGWSVVRYLASHGVELVVTDSRRDPPYLEAMQRAYPRIEFIVNLSPGRYSEFAEVIASPGIKLEGDHIVGDIELFARAAVAPVIAITGSNGKSTVTSLVGEMLAAGNCDAAVGGNIGTPALDLLDRPRPDFYVLELSSFQLETTFSLAPRAATVLNISEDHMDRYDDLQAYTNAKLRVFEKAGMRVINRDEPGFADQAEDPDTISFGLDKPATGQFGIDYRADHPSLLFGDRVLAPVSALTLQGRQNVANVLAAFALVEAAGVQITPSVIDAAMAYGGLPHRCELVATVNGVKWINDSKGTNVGATMAAIQGADKPLVLIAGGQGKGADFSRLGHALADAHQVEGVRGVVLFGEDAEQIHSVIPAGVTVSRVQTLQAAIDAAEVLARSGDTVLFSPACASFDMFSSYAERGDRFKGHVIGIQEKQRGGQA